MKMLDLANSSGKFPRSLRVFSWRSILHGGILFLAEGSAIWRVVQEDCASFFSDGVFIVPVTVKLVLLFDPAMPGTFPDPFRPICLSFIFVLRRVAVTSSKLLARIRELEIVNSFGQMMSSTRRGLSGGPIADQDSFRLPEFISKW